MPRSACCHAALAFERERLGDDRDGERTHFAGQGGDDRRSARAGAAAEAGGDEHHVSAFERFDDLVGVLERGLAADFRIRPGAEAVGQLYAQLNFHGRARHAQRLQIGVSDHELDAFHAGIDHAVDCVSTAAAHADHFDLGVVAGFFVKADADAGSFFISSPRSEFVLRSVSFWLLAASYWLLARCLTLSAFTLSALTFHAPFLAKNDFRRELQRPSWMPRATRARWP